MTAECQNGPMKGQTVMHSSTARFYWVSPDRPPRLIANDSRIDWHEIEKATGVYIPHTVRGQNGKARHVLFFTER